MNLETTGGAEGLRDIGLLEAALEAPYAGFGEVEFYPTINEKAARLGFGIMSNHAFIDGNKRTGATAMLNLLSANGIELEYTQDELVKMATKVADGHAQYEDVYLWLQNHIQKEKEQEAITQNI